MRFNTSLSRFFLAASYAVRQLALGLQGKAFPIAHLHYSAWYESKDKKLPSLTLDEIFPGIYAHNVELRHAIPRMLGNVSVEELHMLALICRHLRPRTIFEFGTFNGRTALNFSLNTPPDTVIYTLDLPQTGASTLEEQPGDEAHHLGEKTGFMLAACSKIRQLWFDSATFDESPYAGQIDFIFVDGAHSYAYVRNDTQKAIRMLKPDGVLLWHDYSAWFPGVSQYLHELACQNQVKHIKGTQLAIMTVPD